MTVVKLIFAIAACSHVVTCLYATERGILGISGGHKISIEQAPFMVSIHHKYNSKLIPICTGSIIQKDYILTAARCFQLNETQLYKIGVGSADLYAPSQLFEIDEVSDYLDLYLIKLKKDLVFGPTVGMAKPSNIEISPGTNLNVTGWGLTNKSHYYTNILHQVEVPMLSEGDCKVIVRNLSIQERNHTVCAGKLGIGICEGDLGSPLTFGNLLVGVAVGGFDLPCGSQKAGVYRKTTSAITSILDMIHDNQ